MDYKLRQENGRSDIITPTVPVRQMHILSSPSGMKTAVKNINLCSRFCILKSWVILLRRSLSKPLYIALLLLTFCVADECVKGGIVAKRSYNGC